MKESPSLQAPLVTLLLLTYRQEEFVAEAVRSALSQDYPNLEVIISDDCSPDRTFKIIQTEVASYDGPHQVIVRQPSHNLGLVAHFFEAATLAKGELIVEADGDDISFLHRVSRLTALWQRTGADGLFSNWLTIDQKGKILGTGAPGTMDLRVNQYFPGREVCMMAGATLAITADALRHISPPAEPLFAQDLYLTLMLHWRGRRVEYINEPLVGYRKHGNALTHVDRERHTLLQYEQEVQLHSRRNADALSLFERLSREAPAHDSRGPQGGLDRAAIAADVAFNRFRSTWLDAGPAQRIRAFLQFREPSQRRWLLPRLLGFHVLWLLKCTRKTLVGS